MQKDGPELTGAYSNANRDRLEDLEWCTDLKSEPTSRKCEKSEPKRRAS